MLHAVLHGKAARVAIDGRDVSWRELFREREDLLTAAFFGRFPYLSREARTGVLDALIGAELSAECGPFQDIEFWPHFDRSGSKGFVEPDVLICFRHLVLVVEVKPPNGGGQYAEQWRNEISAVLAERDRQDSSRDLADRTMVFLALGRNPANAKEQSEKILADFQDDDLSICHLEWSALSTAISSLHNAQEVSGDEKSADMAIYEDWLSAMSMYGILPSRKPFSDLFRIKAEFHQSVWAVLSGWKVASEAEAEDRACIWSPLLSFMESKALGGADGKEKLRQWHVAARG